MNNKMILGWTVILGLSFFPAALWFFLGAGTDELTNYSSITHSLGELAGLVAMTMFALTFILSTRISLIEDVFGGLDKVYIAHGVLGGSALILIMAHPILLVLKFIPSDMRQAALYLLPSSHWSVNFGIIALLGMILLIYITLFTKLKYHHWKFTHEFLGLVFLFAVLHIFLVRGDASKDDIFTGYYVYATVVSLIGIFGFSYSLFIKDRLFKAATYTIQSLKRKNKETYELTLYPEHKPISYKSGQFIFVRFYNERLSKEAHPFTIASRTNNPSIKIIVKELGDFTSKMTHINIGDKVSVEGPYGRFNYERKGDKDQIWIAGGIGITPFLGMAEDLKNHKDMHNKIDLYYSVKENSDLIGITELQEIEGESKNFRVIPWITKLKGHLQISDIFGFSGRFQNKEFYLCGPKQFKHSIINSLIKIGVPQQDIHVEEFDFR